MFTAFFTDAFKKHLEKLTKKDALLKSRLLEQVNELTTEHPFSQIGYVGDLQGKWKMRVNDYRLIYAYCMDCKKYNYHNLNNCYQCNLKDDNSIIFFDVIHRSNDYEL